jgi:ABC-type branched-subunit amino acid transport system substrate-binding protein
MKVFKKSGAVAALVALSLIATACGGSSAKAVDFVFFGGITATGAPLVRSQMTAAGLGDLAFMGGDGIVDGDSKESYVGTAGAAAANSFGSVAGINEELIPDAAGFAAKFEAEFGKAPGAYAASSYACTQVLLTAIGKAAVAGEVNRETVRATAVDPTAKYLTALGTVTFDEVGDTTQRIISLYKVDGGKWSFVDQVNAGEDQTGGDEVTYGAASNGKTLKIGISLPLSGASAASSEPARDGALLAINEANEKGGVGSDGSHAPDIAAADMTAFVADTDVVGVVGPFNSGSAKAQIPVSNEAGLFQCSPSNTNPTLTIGEDGKTLRAANPDKINYVRLCSNDNFQGAALAKYAYTTLNLRSALVIDDTETYGKGLADVFAAEFTKLGGTVVGREAAAKTTTDYAAILSKYVPVTK